MTHETYVIINYLTFPSLHLLSTDYITCFTDLEQSNTFVEFLTPGVGYLGFCDDKSGAFLRNAPADMG